MSVIKTYHRILMAAMVAAVLCIGGASAQAAEVIYTAPSPGIPMSNDYTVTVNGKSVPVYRGEGFDSRKFPDWLPQGDMLPYSFAYFDFDGSVPVSVTSNVKSLNNVVIRPTSKGIASTVSGNTMTFTLNTAPTYISIEPAGKDGPLLLFANPMEESPPSPNDPNVIYFGPGFHQPGQINLSSGQTLYIAGGAVVQGPVWGNGPDITIRGRGILDNWPIPWDDGGGINIRCNDCTNLNIEGVIIKDGPAWTLNINRGDNVTIRNLKIIASSKANQDGIDIINTRNMLVTDSFIRSSDDNIAFKGWDNAPLGQRTLPGNENIVVTKTSLWVDYARNFRIGSEGGLPFHRNVLFQDIDILHYSNTGWDAFSIVPSEEAQLYAMVFDNIRVNHEGQPQLVEIIPGPDYSSFVQVPGQIKNPAGGMALCFKNITVTGDDSAGPGTINIFGADDSHVVDGVSFDNFVRHGQVLQQNSPGLTIGSYVYNLGFSGGGDCKLDTSKLPSDTGGKPGLTIEKSEVCEPIPDVDMYVDKDKPAPVGEEIRRAIGGN